MKLLRIEMTAMTLDQQQVRAMMIQTYNASNRRSRKSRYRTLMMMMILMELVMASRKLKNQLLVKSYAMDTWKVPCQLI